MKSKYTIVICAYGTTIGGMEVLFANYAKYLINEGYNVFWITQDNRLNIYDHLLGLYIDKVTFIRYSPDNILYMSDEKREIQRNFVLNFFSNVDLSMTYGVCGYFGDVVLLMSLFRNNKIKITLIWSHPLNFITYIPFLGNNYYLKKAKKSKLYRYQKELFTQMHNDSASYYTSYSIYRFNKWYFNADLEDRPIEGLPVQFEVGKSFIYNKELNNCKWNILWVGRFDYYKNDAIYYIFETLEQLANERKTNIIFNIVGYGTKKYEKNIRRRVTPRNITVNFLGGVSPEELNDVFEKNDIGISMGVSVKQMGYSGLPAILIDSLSGKYRNEKCCNWVFDIETGDDGDGMFYEIMGSPLLYRETLYKLLSEVFDKPSLLNNYSEKCKKSIEENYSYLRQYEIITEHILNSNFTGYNLGLFRYGVGRVILRKLVKFYRRMCF